MSDSDRQALRLAHDLREEMRAALPQLPAAPSVSPFVDQAGMPSVLLRMDADTARALMALLAERRVERAGPPSGEQRRIDGSHVPGPPSAQAVPAAQGPVVAATFGGPAYGDPAYGDPAYGEPPYGEPAYGGPAYGEPAYGEPPFVQQQPGGPVFTGGTGPTPLVPSVYPTY
ncbi:hypothetical protein [Spirillospora sp. NPDC048824]|uniref:hypothetical protein n=1 Tax=Spirillospora sp. NPDC048824 TaxID=3364526 RepID=UPI0037207CFC